MMRVPALYYGASGAAVPCMPRVWQGFQYLGDMKGTSFDFAEYGDNTPSIITMDSDVLPERGGVFSVEPGEAYRVDRREPRDDITSISHVIRMDESETAGLAVPDSYDTGAFEPPQEDYGPMFGFPEFQRVLLDIPAPVALAPGVAFVLDFTGASTARDTRTGSNAAHTLYVADRVMPLVLGAEYLMQVDLHFKGTPPGNGVHLRMDTQPPATPAPTVVTGKAFTLTTTDPFVTSLPFMVVADADMMANGARFEIEVIAPTDLEAAGFSVNMRAP